MNGCQLKDYVPEANVMGSYPVTGGCVLCMLGAASCKRRAGAQLQAG